MFYRSDSGIWRASALDEIPWLEHGFGSLRANPPEDNLATLRQIHSEIVVLPAGPGLRICDGDALAANRPGLRLGVRTADCLPILLVDERNRAVAAVHAGWRGTVLGVAVRAVEVLAREFGSRSESLRAAIGPGINVCCFEVGPEVAIRFEKLFPERNDLDRRTKVDLVETNCRQLAAAGLDPERISRGAPCTCCTSGEFHSWRRDGAAAGRMLSVVEILA